MPTDVERARIIATCTGNSSNFTVDNGYVVFVDERLGTAWNQTRYEGTHRVLGGGYFGITNSSGVVWSFEEIR